MKTPDLSSALDALVLRAQKPSRYVGGELGSVAKDLSAAGLRFALAFPDTYEVGMSNLGFRLLYHLLNDRPEIACERVFLPWPDLDAMLREEGLPLFTLESRAPVAGFDVLGVTLQFELAYTSVLALLELAGIPLRACDRTDAHPLVLGGGPCAYNPEPVADFFDAFAVGDGEEVALEIADAVRESGFRRGGASRAELLRRLARVPGVYVPSLFAPRYDRATGVLAAMEPLLPGYEKVERRIVADLNALPTSAYTRPIVPFMQTVHDRLPIEIQRGCTRGCRFCQVGMLTRPTRQRDPRQVLALAEAGLGGSGYEEVGLLSLSSGDYDCLNPLLDDFLARWEGERIAMSLPSLRTETLSGALAERIARIRKTGFTLAPEAATERMRAVINKGNREEDLLRAVESVFANGWSLLKLYFMIGLPDERDEDVVAIAELARRSLATARRAAQGGGAALHLAVSTFVPKPFTPFQWEPMIPPEETRRRQALISAALGGRHGAIQYRPHDSRQSSIEGALALGDRRVGTAILAAYRRGQRLDAWTEWFVEQRWLDAFADCEREHGVGLDGFAHRRRGVDEVLPWDRIDCGVTRKYLTREREAARRLAQTEDCVTAACSACGVCDFEVVKNRVYEAKDYVPAPPPAPRPAGSGGAHPCPRAIREARPARGAVAPRDDARAAPGHPPCRPAGGVLAGIPSEATRLVRSGARRRNREPVRAHGPRAARTGGPRGGRLPAGEPASRGVPGARGAAHRSRGTLGIGGAPGGALPRRISPGTVGGRHAGAARCCLPGGRPLGGHAGCAPEEPARKAPTEHRRAGWKRDRLEANRDPSGRRGARNGCVQLEGRSCGKRQASRGAGRDLRRRDAAQGSEGLEGRRELRENRSDPFRAAACASLPRRLNERRALPGREEPRPRVRGDATL